MSTLAIGATAVSIPLVANAALTHSTHKTKKHTTHLASKTARSTANGKETPLSGATLTSASAAATAAVPGGTVESATTETDATGAYEVILTKPDGSHVKVIEDANFTVLSTSATTCR
jgi:uncharacterized membrane protein YkoI